MIVKQANAEPIPGYRLIERLGSGGFGEVWKCEAPGGLFKAVKFVSGNLKGLDSARVEEELRAVQRIKTIRHPFLLSLERVECLDGELVIVMELADRNLHELRVQYQEAGQPGVPRKELLGFVQEAAEVLDLMNQQHHLQHLDIKPHNLFLLSGHVKVGDFGLVNNLGGGTTSLPLGAITPLYASPELFAGRPSRFSDQYSLAIVYQELLTNRLPFSGKNSRQLLFQHTKEKPDLSPLPPHDHRVLARALAKDPEKRFPSCMKFVEALQTQKLSEKGSDPLFCAQGGQATSNRARGLTPFRTDKNPDLGPIPGARRGSPDATALPLPGSFPEDTVKNLGQDTVQEEVPGDWLPGYQVRECLGRSALMEKWRVQAADGRLRLAKVLQGCGQALEQAVARLRGLRHPFLKESEIVRGRAGQVVLLSDPVKETLRDRFCKCRARRLPGIPRKVLLDYLGMAARALDELYREHVVQHLCLNPRALVLLDDGQLQITGFGLAQLLWLPAGQDLARLNPRYIPPEMFHLAGVEAHAAPRPQADQYALALIFHEMLTGAFAFPGRNGYSPRDQVTPNLERLPAADREILARALAPDPARRWPDCRTFISSLARSVSEGPILTRSACEVIIRARSASEGADEAGAKRKPTQSASEGKPGIPGEELEKLDRVIADLLTVAEEPSAQPTSTLSKEKNVLSYKFRAGLPLGQARDRLGSFCRQSFGQMVREDERGCGFTVPMPSNSWSQWLGRQPALDVQVILDPLAAAEAALVEVAAQVRVLGCGKNQAAGLLQHMGLPLLDRLRAHLLLGSPARAQERLPWPHPLRVRPLYPDGSTGDLVPCRCKDISAGGIGFFLPGDLDTSEVLIELPSIAHPPALSVPATLVRAKAAGNGIYEVGALFRLTGTALAKNTNITKNKQKSLSMV